jgi:hypothetical protein
LTSSDGPPDAVPILERLRGCCDLLEPDEVDWTHSRTPLAARGVRLDWLVAFVQAVDQAWRDVVRERDSQVRASTYFEGVPEPGPLPFSRHIETSKPAFLVPQIIKPMTRDLEVPLYARVPHAARGEPQVFLSHAWTNPLIGGNPFTTLYAIGAYRKAPETLCVWLDAVCYNQHRAEAIADDMKTVIGSIGHIMLPMVNSVPFSRLWCLWELLCAHVAGADVDIREANGSVYDLGFLARGFDTEFESVTQAETRLTADRTAILDSMRTTFGSLENASEHIRSLVLGQLSKDSDKPWHRP